MPKPNKQSLPSLLNSLKLSYLNPNITKANFPDDGRRGEVDIISFDRIITSEEAIKEASEIGYLGYRPATAYELLHWAKENRNDKDWVIALGQTWRAPHGDLFVLVLWGDAGSRRLHLHRFEGRWFRFYRFAFVRKESSELDTLESWKGRALKAEEKLEKIKNLII